MAIKDWPLPIRRTIGWSIVTLTIAIALAPLALVFSAARADEPLSWTRLLGGYALVVTVPTTVVVAGFIAFQLQREKRSSFGFAVLMGATVGIGIGLLLGLVTGGYSLLSAPASSLLAFLVAWALQFTKANKPSPP